jgi:hypothetical protein
VLAYIYICLIFGQPGSSQIVPMCKVTPIILYPEPEVCCQNKIRGAGQELPTAVVKCQRVCGQFGSMLLRTSVVISFSCGNPVPVNILTAGDQRIGHPSAYILTFHACKA